VAACVDDLERRAEPGGGRLGQAERHEAIVPAPDQRDRDVEHPGAVGDGRPVPEPDGGPRHAPTSAPMFAMTTGIVCARTSVGLNSTISVPA
jgi:hypothetical protein